MCKPDRKNIAQASLRDRRINILHPVVRPFVGQGFAATSLDRVSDEIGSGRGIYCYYRRKPDLFLSVHRRAMELAQRAIRPPRESGGKVLVRLRRWRTRFRSWRSFPISASGTKSIEMHLLERTNEGERAQRAEVGMLREANEALYIHIIEEGITSGEPRNLRLMAKSLLGVLNRTSRWYHTHEGESGAGRMPDSISEFVGALA